jgi:hypothetical protein
MKTTDPRGGKRKGAGRKPGSGAGRKVETASISMPPELWEKADGLRGEKSRSAWIADKVRKARL